MTKTIRKFALFVVLSVFANCSQVLQSSDLKIDIKDDFSQEEFKILKNTYYCGSKIK